VVKSVDDAIERINSCQYSLTSAVFAEDPAVIEFIEDKLNVGTVYLNKCL
jgi:acyl-CoA reductase-like NAD-dependent aldehyde dehydrogenase